METNKLTIPLVLAIGVAVILFLFCFVVDSDHKERFERWQSAQELRNEAYSRALRQEQERTITISNQLVVSVYVCSNQNVHLQQMIILQKWVIDSMLEALEENNKKIQLKPL